MKKNLKIAIALFIVGGLIFGAWQLGIFNNIQFPGLPTGVVHQGPIVFYCEGRADDDTANYDGTGTAEVIDANSLVKREATQTLGTDTETDDEYRSGESLIWVWKSETANCFDHFAVELTLPYGDYAAGPAVAGSGLPLWEIQWSPGQDKWIFTTYLALECQPTLLGYKAQGGVWDAAATDSYTFSSTVNYHSGTLKIGIATNYAGVGAFFDPEEGGEGEMDRLIIVATQNTTVPNQGVFIMGGGWTPCKDSNDYYYDVTPHLGPAGLLIRHDEEGHDGLIEIPIELFCNGDCDTSDTYDSIFTFTLYECSSLDDAYNQNMDSDTLDNFSTDPTAETCEVTDG